MTKHITHFCSQRNIKRTIPSRTIGCGMGYLQWWYFFRQYSKCTVVDFGNVKHRYFYFFDDISTFEDKTIFYVFLFLLFCRRNRRYRRQRLIVECFHHLLQLYQEKTFEENLWIYHSFWNISLCICFLW